MGACGKAFGLIHRWAVTPPEDQLGSLRPSDQSWQGVQGQSARSQQRGLFLLAGKRLALVKTRMGCCLAAVVPTPM